MNGKILNLKKILVSVLLAAVCAPLPGNIFYGQQEARALAIPLPESVPVRGTGGWFTGIGKIGSVDVVKLDQTSMMSQIQEAANISTTNAALQAVGGKFLDKVNLRLGIKNPLNYQNALVEGKYLVDVYRKVFGKDAVKSCESGDISCLVTIIEKSPLSKVFSKNQAADLAIKILKEQNPADRQKLINRLVVGATTLFSSSIICGGLDIDAVQNTAAFLATSNAGMRPSQIRADGLNFYTDMARFTDPFSDPAFVEQQLPFIAAEAEAKAKEGAVLELSTPGIKVPQGTSNTGDNKGFSQIDNSLNLIQEVQQKAQSTIFDIAVRGVDSKYAAKSFLDFIHKVADQAISDIFNQYLDQYLGNFGSLLGRIVDKVKLDGMRLYFQSAAQLIARSVVKSFTDKLFNHVSKAIFKGKVLEESPSCRGARTETSFTADDTSYRYTENPPIDAFDSSGGSGGSGGSASFKINGLEDVSVAADESIEITWDTSELSITVNTLSIEKTGETAFYNLSIPSGAYQDIPFPEGTGNTLQEYRLVINEGLSNQQVVLGRFARLVSGAVSGAFISEEIKPRE